LRYVAARTGEKRAVPAKLRDDLLSFAIGRRREDAHPRLLRVSEGENPLHAGIKGVAFRRSHCDCRRKNGGAARLTPTKISALASAMASDVPEIFEMAGAMVVINAHGRTNAFNARISPHGHADLEHAESRFAFIRARLRGRPNDFVGSGRRRDGAAVLSIRRSISWSVACRHFR